MESEDRQAGTTDPGIGRDIGQGYPEEQPPGASPHGEIPPRSGGQTGERAPETAAPERDDPERARTRAPTPDRDAGPGQATGNPDAAG